VKRNKLLIAATEGGHLSEAMALFEGELHKNKLMILTGKSSREYSSHVKVLNYKAGKGSACKVLTSFFFAFFYIVKHKPTWIITTGAEVGVGAIYAGKLLRCQTMFIETVTRYKSATKAARLCYPLVDKFYVQHKEGLRLFDSKAEYIGGLM